APSCPGCPYFPYWSSFVLVVRLYYKESIKSGKTRPGVLCRIDLNLRKTAYTDQGSAEKDINEERQRKGNQHHKKLRLGEIAPHPVAAAAGPHDQENQRADSAGEKAENRGNQQPDNKIFDCRFR